MKPKISVIVPIYNTEKYLDKCLTSIINQTMQEIEIICIDDCSPDDSYLIVEKFMAQDSRVSLIRHEKNKGSGGARNTGILAAKADFLASVDSDDYIKPEMMQTLWDASNNGAYDIVRCGYEVINEIEDKKTTYCPPIKTVNPNNKMDIFFLIDPMFWNKIWRKSLFINNEFFFPERMFYPDQAITPRLLAKASLVKTIKNPLYVYRVRHGAVSTSYTDKHIIDTFRVIDLISEFLERNGLSRTYKKEFAEFIDFIVLCHSKRVLKSGMKEDEVNMYLRHMLMMKSGYLKHSKVNKISQEKLLDLLSNRSTNHKVAEFIFRPFVTSKQYIKLKNTPKRFFRDSNNKIARLVGRLLRLV